MHMRMVLEVLAPTVQDSGDADVGAKVVMKTGAEGVYAAALPTLGLGVALKVEDGAGRAAEVAMGRVLHELKLLNADEEKTLADALTPPIRNRVGRETGRIRPAADDAS